MKRFAIAVDGPAGSGKSTVAKLVAKRLGLFMWIRARCTVRLRCSARRRALPCG